MKRLLRLCRNRKSSRELLSTSEASWATTKSGGMWDAEAEETRELTTKPESPMMLQRSHCRKRSIDMTSNAGLISQDSVICQISLRD